MSDDDARRRQGLRGAAPQGAGWWGARLLAGGADGAVWARSAAAGGQSVTFGALRAETARLARTLSCHGIRPGATVALHGSPGFTHLWSVLALWSLDAQVLLLEPALSGPERAALLDLARPQYVVTLGESHGDEERFVPECEVLVRRRPGGRPAATAHRLVQFSSGTTGRPKPAGRTPGSLLTEVRRLGALPLMPRAGESVAVLEPVAHSFALIGGVLHALAVGATVVLPASAESDAVTEAAASAHVVLGRPRHFGVLAGAPAGVRLERLRLAVSGGDVLPGAVAGAFARRYGVLVGQAYGTTETGIVATDLAGGHGPGALGVPVPGVRTRVVGGALQVRLAEAPDPYGPVAHGPSAPGPSADGASAYGPSADEPSVYGPSVYGPSAHGASSAGDAGAAGPAGAVDAADRVWADGWLATHDLVARDPATGALRLRGRTGRAASGADLLDIEEVLRAHRHVREAVVLGPDPVEAHVAGTAELRPAELSAWCRRFLGERSAPRRFHVVPELARSASGKVLRDRARLHERGWAPRPAVAAGRRR
ncbi:class I adenylate-forming enzyme family protein [Streptomyces sp. NRRL S-87]|uniref:class I adenylate-forming enzyme family protein n=1 Tax=Streptomyces sp. NRRL S-87 TaxID=1463920 RepID=UPI0007C586AB|nr:class I adenylate-forming enzyme family protein [Streptomyces sp. NRRL S-87]